MALSAEAQHVIDSLEAHLVAVKAAVASAEPTVLAHAKQFGEDALAAIEDFGAKLRGGADSLVAHVEQAGNAAAAAGKNFEGSVTPPPVGNATIPGVGKIVGGVTGAPAEAAAADVGSAAGTQAGSLG